MNDVDTEPERVVYLLGAGATHGCADFLGSDVKLIMPNLIEQLRERMRELYVDQFAGNSGIERLVNDVVTEETDIEQLITFLDDAISGPYRDFASQLKEIFSFVLRARLAKVRIDYGERHSELFAALIDMHNIAGVPELLQGFLTLNYDLFLEHAIEERFGLVVDYGVSVASGNQEPADDALRRVPVLKLHGSFGWSDSWPIAVAAEDSPGLWIPPGIRKAKAEYPFNAIWGRARELLDCDVLRVIGCNLGPNDWDLVSMLFTTMHTHASRGPYRIEIISRPGTAETISSTFPYLNVLSLLELPDVGPQVISEVTGGSPREYQQLTEDEQRQAHRRAQETISNAFERWLRMRGEILHQEFSIETDSGIFMDFMDAGI